MAYDDDTYEPGNIAAQDLQQIEDNFEYLRTNFKGTTQPANPGGGLEGVIWWDSGNKTFKGRSDSEWRGIFSGNASFKIWAYLNSTPDGWSRDTDVTDMVLGLKSDSGTYATGAAEAGSWTISGIGDCGHTHTMGTHNHKWYNNDTDSDIYNSAGSPFTVPTSSGTGAHIVTATGDRTGYGLYELSADGWTTKVDPGDTNSGTASVSHTPGWRIKAAVGIMLYPKL